ncbi:MAG TPA: hypothetical protein VGD22_14250 [Sphingobacteriaceae bacterium]
MNNPYKYLITACIVLIIQSAAAQQLKVNPKEPVVVQPKVAPVPPAVPDRTIKIEAALRNAEKCIKDAELKINALKLDEKFLATIDKKTHNLIRNNDLKLNLQKELLKLNELKFGRESEIKKPYDTGWTSVIGPSAIIEKQKQVSKTYKVNSKDKLSINNQYGRITVNTWKKREIKVDISIKSFETSESKAQELLDGVTISESKQGNVISFKTTIERKSRGWGTIKRNNEPDVKRGIEVFYTVYMPAENALDITNLHGNVVLPDLKGPVNLTTSYSSLNAQNLENSTNKINMNYGSATIESLSGNLNISYGSLNLVNADKLNANIRYNSSAKINKLTNNANLEIRYTPAFKINEVDKNVDNLLINSSYSGITLGFDKTANYNFEVTVSYSGFKYDNKRIVITDKSPDEKHRGFVPTNSYKGYYGSGAKNSSIVIKSSYGAGVSFL